MVFPSCSIDFVLAFLQAELKVHVCMELLIGFDAPANESQGKWVVGSEPYPFTNTHYELLHSLARGM